MQTTGGSLNPNVRVKLAWGLVQSATAAVLLWQGGLGALQTASILAAFPFVFILLMVIFSLVKEFREEARNALSRDEEETNRLSDRNNVLINRKLNKNIS